MVGTDVHCQSMGTMYRVWNS